MVGVSTSVFYVEELAVRTNEHVLPSKSQEIFLRNRHTDLRVRDPSTLMIGLEILTPYVDRSGELVIDVPVPSHSSEAPSPLVLITAYIAGNSREVVVPLVQVI